MQVSGFGSGHNSDMHHVTDCMHSHSHYEKVGSAASAASSTSSAVNTAQQQLQEGFSFAEWLKDPLGNTKKLLGKLWNGSEQGSSTAAAAISTRQETDGVEEVMAQILDTTSTEADSLSGSMRDSHSDSQQHQQQSPTIHTPQVAAASTAINQQNLLQHNPYFSTVEDKGQRKQTLLEKMRVRLQNVTGFLTKRFASSGRNAAQTGQQRPREDLSRHSRYREEELEIDCILTDDSYLMDSYNQKGEYRRLSTDK